MLIHQPTQSLLLNVPDPFAIRELIPQSKSLDVGEHNVVVRHTLEATKVLRNIGINVPAPINVFYDWPGKYKPMAQQKVMAEFRVMHKKCFDLSEMGTGKTAASLWAADWLMETGVIRKALVICKMSQMRLTWMRDLFDVLMHRKGIVLHGSQDQRLWALGQDVDFYVINHDGLKIGAVRQAIRKRPDIDLVIVDEGGEFRNHDRQKYKALEAVLRDDMRLWWLTGTPCPNAPTDVWSQVRLVNPPQAPKFFGQFRRMTMVDMKQGNGYANWVARPDAYKIAYEAMQPAIRFRKSECLDLPPITTEDREAELTVEQRAAYKSMRNEMILENARARETGTPITAVNAADKINKLRQILCGAIRHTVTGEYHTLPHGPRLQVLIEAIEEASAKAIVVVPFKGIIYELEKGLTKAGYTIGILNGDVTLKNREKIITNFKTTPNPQILLCHPAVMAHGLNLVEADVTIFYAPIYSNDQFQQVIERFNRVGQMNKMTIIRIAAHALEWEIYKILDNKGDSQDNVLKLYKSIIE